MIFGYIRVSTTDQQENFSLKNQREQLIKKGVPEEKIFEDICSGTTLDRPALQKLLEQIKAGDVIYITRFDRFSVNLLRGFSKVNEIREKGAKIVFLDIPETSNPLFSDFFMLIIAYFAEYDYNLRKERQKEGIAKAKLAGKYKGRRTVITPQLKEKINELVIQKKVKKTDVASLLRISPGTLYKALKIMEQEGKK